MKNNYMMVPRPRYSMIELWAYRQEVCDYQYCPMDCDRCMNRFNEKEEEIEIKENNKEIKK